MHSDEFETTMINFLESIGNDTDTSKLLFGFFKIKVVIPFLNAVQKDSMWFKIMVDFPTDRFEIPRWHFDGPFYANNSNETVMNQLKLAGSLVGPGTLFKKTNSESISNFTDKYIELYKDADRTKYLSNRQILDTHLKNVETVQASNNEIAIFAVGNRTKAAIHSEPNINRKRLFFSIIPGNTDNIKELAKSRNKEFLY